MLSHEIIRPLTEMFDTDQQYFRLANGDVIRADFRQAGLNTDAMPGTVKIGTVDPKIMPSAATTAIQPWDKARPNIRAAIQKWVQDGQQSIQEITDADLDENLHKWFKEKWVRFGPDGKIRGDCARGSDSEGKPKCLPQSKAHALGKKGRASAAAKKRREDPNPERRGAAINVATKKKTSEAANAAQQAAIAIAMKKSGKKPHNEDQQLDEKCWDTHRQAGMKRKGDRMVPNCVPRESKEQCPECGGEMYPDSMIAEKKDACYYKVKSRYKVWPSAYASGALVKCRKKGAKNWGNKSEGVAEGSLEEGWKDWAVGAALGAAALGGAVHAQAADLSGYNTQYLQQVARGEHPRPTVSVDDAKAELQARANGKQQTVAPERSASSNGFSKEYLQSVVDGTHPRPMISVEKAQQLLNQMKEGVAEDQLAEKWSEKYKKSINCNNPQGFSQRAHCAGRKKNESADDPDQFGGMHVDDFQQKLMRLKKLAGAGPLQTVYDPKQRVYRNMPTAQQPPKQPKK